MMVRNYIYFTETFYFTSLYVVEIIVWEFHRLLRDWLIPDKRFFVFLNFVVCVWLRWICRRLRAIQLDVLVFFLVFYLCFIHFRITIVCVLVIAVMDCTYEDK
jgi:hypothetical protein